MSASVAVAALTDARRALDARWRTLRAGWDDAAAARFEEDVIRPLEADLKRAIAAAQELQAFSARSRKEHP